MLEDGSSLGLSFSALRLFSSALIYNRWIANLEAGKRITQSMSTSENDNLGKAHPSFLSSVDKDCAHLSCIIALAQRFSSLPSGWGKRRAQHTELSKPCSVSSYPIFWVHLTNYISFVRILNGS